MLADADADAAAHDAIDAAAAAAHDAAVDAAAVIAPRFLEPSPFCAPHHR